MCITFRLLYLSLDVGDSVARNDVEGDRLQAAAGHHEREHVVEAATAATAASSAACAAVDRDTSDLNVLVSVSAS